jgi:hypothetical protein
VANTGRQNSTVASSPPIMTSSRPAAAPIPPPLTGASISGASYDQCEKSILLICK